MTFVARGIGRPLARCPGYYGCSITRNDSARATYTPGLNLYLTYPPDAIHRPMPNAAQIDLR